MIWWLIAGLLLLASLFLVYPFIRHDRTVVQDDADANLQIFRDQQAQLDSQLQQQEIKQPQYEQLLAEAKQLLLLNSQKPQVEETVVSVKVGRLLPVALLLLPIFCLASYHYLGAAADEKILKMLEVNTQLSVDDPQAQFKQQELFSAIEKRAAQRPDNIYYWILLAKRAVQQNDLSSAQYHYAQAIKASPEDSYLLAQYAEITFMLADSQFTDEVNRAIDKAFAIDSSNPTVLGLKGIQAFETEQWQLAITYWQEASRQMEQGSPTATALKAGIARAQMRLGIEPEQQLSPQVEISVSIDKAIQFDPNQTVFVALVAISGAPMPLAAKKLRAGDLPTTITLSNSDAVMEGYNLSSVNEVKAVARLSETGSATPQAGDWEAAIQRVDLSSGKYSLALEISRQRL
ncbi:c-type cytochrome biogenesis protein CcmI [Porticoccaceae bacterium]|jgi:cytochrome c-type biogenesis protein CcmH|nr:c-type cytochrome biogenesis protein CcmI [Porticoccaceae bacterium]